MPPKHRIDAPTVSSSLKSRFKESPPRRGPSPVQRPAAATHAKTLARGGRTPKTTAKAPRQPLRTASPEPPLATPAERSPPPEAKDVGNGSAASAGGPLTSEAGFSDAASDHASDVPADSGYGGVVDELIWSDGDEDEESRVVDFPNAEDLQQQQQQQDDAAGGGGSVIRLGTTQHLDETDSSEDEAVLNRVGDIPLEWYKNEEHIGYDITGAKLLKSERSALDRLLEATDDPNAMRTVFDALHQEKKVLSNADLQMIFNLQRNRTTNAAYDMYAEAPERTVEFDPLNHPLARNTGPSKMKFTPALHDMKVIAKMLRRLRQEREARKQADADADADTKQQPLLWEDGRVVEMDTHTHFKYSNRIPKPKVPPPGTYESYRPPPEYLPSERARQRQARLRAIDRKEHFLPHSFDALRHVPFYARTIQDRYQRCLDLAFFPRAQRTRLVVDPNKLLPELPDVKDLRPYPERLSFHYKGHTATVRSLALTPNGQYLATGCDDHMVRVYEVHTGRLMKRFDVGAPVQQVEFCPSRSLNLLAVAVEYSLVFIVPTFAAHAKVNEHTVRYLRAPGFAAGLDSAAHLAGGADALGGHGITQSVMDTDEVAHQATTDLHDVEEKEKRAEFLDASGAERRAGIVVKVALHAKIKKFTFHARGDYICALCPKDHVKYRQTIMLQLSRRRVFCPFRKFAEVVTDCRFHPREPVFFLSTTNAVRCYNLLAHKLQRRYKAPGGITTCLALHPDGDHFLVGDTTSHTSWYDTDYSDRPYKRMRSHRGVVAAVAFHPTTAAYPLFATGASDGQVHVFHGMVYDDYTRNALLVPLKILKHRRPVYSVAWHPTLPWLFTSTEDGMVSAWTE